MASLYRPKIVEYALPDGSCRTPDGKRVTKDTPGAVRTQRRSPKWDGRYADASGKLQHVPLSESKETARRMLRKLMGDAELAGVGIVDPYAEHRARPLAEHLEDYRRLLAGKGNTAEHVGRQHQRCKAVLDGCRFTTLDDLQSAAVVDYLDTLRQDDGPLALEGCKELFTNAELVAVLGIHPQSVSRMLRRLGLTAAGNGKARRYPRAVVEALRDELSGGSGVTTRNHYLVAVKGFTRWLAREHRVAADPLAHLTRQNPDVDVRHPRRALPEALFAAFVEATASGTPFRGLTGTDRLVLYTLAANTGFRAGELASLTPASFDLGAKPPTVTVQAAYSKHRREDVQPLRPDVADMMRQYLAGRPKGRPVWPGHWHDDGALVIQHDLQAAGIPYRDDAGRFFDFHALRGQFISQLAAAGVHPKVAQTLARHSTITLTLSHYTHLDAFDVAGALDKLPRVVRPESQAEPPAAESA